MKNKYCPLLSAAEGDSLVTCQGELCAWYVPPVRHGDGGRCAVQALDPGEQCDCQATADRKEDDTNEQAQEIR